jgi:hypothetical protein
VKGMTRKELEAGKAALRKLRDTEMPWYARSSVTEEVIERIAYAVLEAAEDARGAVKNDRVLSTKDIKPRDPADG